jgi:hypothetical protein
MARAILLSVCRGSGSSARLPAKLTTASVMVLQPGWLVEGLRLGVGHASPVRPDPSTLGGGRTRLPQRKLLAARPRQPPSASSARRTRCGCGLSMLLQEGGVPVRLRSCWLDDLDLADLELLSGVLAEVVDRAGHGCEAAMSVRCCGRVLPRWSRPGSRPGR